MPESICKDCGRQYTWQFGKKNEFGLYCPRCFAKIKKIIGFRIPEDKSSEHI